MSKKKKYTAFISYANPDEALAQHIKALFEFMGHAVYFAPVALREEAGEEWRLKMLITLYHLKVHHEKTNS